MRIFIDLFIKAVSSTNQTTALQLFNARRQRSGEKAFEYGLELKRLSTQCFVGLPPNTIDNLVLFRFLDGLAHPLKANLRLSMPKNMEEAMSNSLILEAQPRNDITMNNIRNQQPHNVSKREQRLTPYKGKLPVVRMYNPDRQDRRNNAGTQDRELQKQEKTQEKVSAVDLSNTKCYRCGKLGHIKARCPNSLNYRGQNFKDSGQK